MAIKAGLVGVNPKGVDKNGMPISSGISDVEAEIQQINLDIAQLQTSKVGIGQLTANNKAFHFAYDATSEKYGYKLDGTGEFIPFEQAGGGPGWVKPAETVTTGVTLTGCTIESGGYYDNNDVIIVDVVIKLTATNASIKTLPAPKGGGANLIGKMISDTTDESYTNAQNWYSMYSTGNITGISGNSGNYIHIWGEYEKN